MTSSLLLKLTGQGAVYIRALDCLDGEEDDDVDDDLLKAAWEIESLPEGLSFIPENHTQSAPSTGQGMMTTMIYLLFIDLQTLFKVLKRTILKPVKKCGVHKWANKCNVLYVCFCVKPKIKSKLVHSVLNVVGNL